MLHFKTLCRNVGRWLDSLAIDSELEDWVVVDGLTWVFQPSLPHDSGKRTRKFGTEDSHMCDGNDAD